MSDSSQIRPKRYSRKTADIFALHNAYKDMRENPQMSKIVSEMKELHRRDVSRLKKIIKEQEKQISDLQKALDLERRLLSE